MAVANGDDALATNAVPTPAEHGDPGISGALEGAVNTVLLQYRTDSLVRTPAPARHALHRIVAGSQRIQQRVWAPCYASSVQAAMMAGSPSFARAARAAAAAAAAGGRGRRRRRGYYIYYAFYRRKHLDGRRLS
jgi:hypothetical protein